MRKSHHAVAGFFDAYSLARELAFGRIQFPLTDVGRFSGHKDCWGKFHYVQYSYGFHKSSLWEAIMTDRVVYGKHNKVIARIYFTRNSGRSRRSSLAFTAMAAIHVRES